MCAHDSSERRKEKRRDLERGRKKDWTLGVSIPLPPACEAGALPSELNALVRFVSPIYTQHTLDLLHQPHPTSARLPLSTASPARGLG